MVAAGDQWQCKESIKKKLIIMSKLKAVAAYGDSDDNIYPKMEEKQIV